MKTSLNWLNDYLDRPARADEIATVLADAGFPVETIEDAPSATGKGERDVMLDVEVTSNRSDCLSHVGVAREIAAATGRSLRPPEVNLPAVDSKAAQESTRIENKEPDLCPLYTARVIRGVKVGPSPDWLVDRLAAIGQDSINNVADITNYVQMELGQPLHAFDYNKLKGSRIVVRRAKAGERMLALNGETYEFRDEHLVIADAERPVALAGVMGGEETGVREETVDVLLEAALFDRVTVRNAVRGLKVTVKNKPGTESSYRFERGVDPLGVDRASRRAAQMILDLAGGELCEEIASKRDQTPTPRAITMRVERCNQLLGTQLSADDMLGYLDRLGLFPLPNGDGETITCNAPTFRLDLEREVDLIEEVARSHGLNNIPVREKIDIVTRPLGPNEAARRTLRSVLIAHGYHEAVTFSFLPTKQAERFAPGGDEPVRVAHDRRKAEPFLRPSVLPSLLTCRKTNQDVGNACVKLFETASTWSRHQGGAIVERERLAIIADVDEAAGRDVVSATNHSLRGLRGAVEEMIESLGGAGVDVSITPSEVANLSAAAAVSVNGETIGALGVLDDATQKLFDLQVRLVAAEFDLAPLLALYPPQRQVGVLPRYPAIERDLSIIVDEAVRWRQVRQSVEAAKPDRLERLEFIDTYRGKPIPVGRKSVTLRMLFRDPETTLRHEQVDPQVDAVIKRLTQDVSAELRG